MAQLDPDIAHALERTTAGGWLPLTGGSVADARSSYRELSLLRRGDGYEPPPVASVSDETFAGPGGPIAARIYVPDDAIDAIVVFLHGGGWVIGDLDTHDPVCRRLAGATRAVVAAIDYRLAPEAPHPAPSDDAMAALRWAAARWPGHRLAVAGDSAGGGLAAGCALRCRDEPDAPALAAQLLIYPGIDPEMRRPSIAENGVGLFLEAADMTWFYDHYLPDATMRRDPVVNPFCAEDLSGLAPAVITVAEFDPLRDEGREYAARLDRAGVAVTLIEAAGMVHGYLGMVELSPAAERAAAEVRAAFAALLA